MENEERCQLPLEQVLPNSCVDLLKHREDRSLLIPEERLSMRLSVRLTEQEYSSFAEFCQAGNMTQREAIQLLIANAKNGENVSVSSIREKNRRIQQLEEEIDRLKRIPREVTAYKQLKDGVALVQKGITEYVSMCVGDHRHTGRKLQCVPWRKLMRENQRFYDYPYPEEGVLLLEVEALCYSKGRNSAIFVFGIDCNTGKTVKLRYYPRNDYCGVSPRNDTYFSRNAWFVAGGEESIRIVQSLYLHFPWHRSILSTSLLYRTVLTMWGQ